MEKVTIDKNVLRRMLLEAYEAGWYGTLELKDQTVEELLVKFKDLLGDDKFIPISVDASYRIINDQPPPPNINLSFEIPMPHPIQLDFGDVRIIDDAIQIRPEHWESVGDG